MSRKNRKWLVIVLIVLFAGGYIFRFYVLNATFPKGKVTTIPLGETVEYDNVKYTAHRGRFMTAEEFNTRYNTDDYYDKGTELLVVQFDLKNTTNIEQKIHLSDMVVQCDSWANGEDYYSLWYLNGNDFDGTLSAKEQTTASIVVIVNTNKEKLLNSGNEWKVRMSEYPERLEMVFPVEVEE